jgi:hypothetical protein
MVSPLFGGSAPMTLEVDGKLHLAVIAGCNFQLNYDAILVFALD